MAPSIPKVIVGLDLGSSSSGFAYAMTSEPSELIAPCGCPKNCHGDGLAFNTPTILHYSSRMRAGIPTYDLVNWGWSAKLSYVTSMAQAHAEQKVEVAMEECKTKHYLVQDFNFLQLAGPGGTEAGDNRKSHGYKERSVRRTISTWLGLRKDDSKMLRAGISEILDGVLYHRLPTEWKSMEANGPSMSQLMDFSGALPPGLQLERVISDYLAMLADFALTHLQRIPKYGPHLTGRMVQWCLTVPALWDDSTRKGITRCAKRAGLVARRLCLATRTSSHPLLIVLESEAAAISCSRQRASTVLAQGDKFMVVDMGGSKVEVAVHKQMDEKGSELVQVAASSRCMCGGSQVDNNFICYLAEKFRMPCLDERLRQNPKVACSILAIWEQIKKSVNGSESWCRMDLEIARLLAVVIKQQKCLLKLEITCNDMKRMFDPVVDKVVELIRGQMLPDMKVVMAVGGLSTSRYVMRRIRDEFGEQAVQIISPRDPSSAICRGAVILGLQSKQLPPPRIVHQRTEQHRIVMFRTLF